MGDTVGDLFAERISHNGPFLFAGMIMELQAEIRHEGGKNIMFPVRCRQTYQSCGGLSRGSCFWRDLDLGNGVVFGFVFQFGVVFCHGGRVATVFLLFCQIRMVLCVGL